MTSSTSNALGTVLGAIAGFKIGGLVFSIGLAASMSIVYTGAIATATLIGAPIGIPVMALGGLGTILSLKWGIDSGVSVFHLVHDAIAGKAANSTVVHHHYHPQQAPASSPVVIIGQEPTKPQPQSQTAPNIHFVYQAADSGEGAHHQPTAREATYQRPSKRAHTDTRATPYEDYRPAFFNH